MKRIAIPGLIVLICLAGCASVADTLTGFDPEIYARLTGSWLVTEKPDDWTDYRYVFAEDRSFEIQYYTGNVNTNYRGRVIGTELGAVEVRKVFGQESSYADKMIMCYRLIGARGDKMELGWFDNNRNPVYYLTLVRESP